MIVEDELKLIKLPKDLEPFIGPYYKALCKRSEMSLVGESEYLCFKRFLDMYNSGKYIFASKAINRLFEFLSFLIFVDEDGKPHHLNLYPVQRFIMCGIFGLRHKDGRYLAHAARLYMARRNGKSFLLGAVLHALMGMSKFRNELIILASCKAQSAQITFNEYVKLIDNDPYLQEQYSNISRTACWARHKYTHNKLQIFKTGGAAKSTLDGHTNKVCVVDEEALVDEIITKTLADGQAHFQDSLLVTMSTAQFSIGSNNHKKWLNFRQQLRTGELPDDLFYFLADPDDEDIQAKDYASIKFWGKANPVLLYEQDGYTIKQFVKRNYLQKARTAAQVKGFELQSFVTKQANLWYAAEDRSLCSYEQLCDCRVDYGFEDVVKAGYKYFYLGVDLAQVLDLASVNWQCYVYEDAKGHLVAPGEEYSRKRLFVHTVSWMPRNRLQQHVEKDKFCYHDYIDTELFLCDSAGGENIDINQIYEYMAHIKETYGIFYVTCTADPYNFAGIEDRVSNIVENVILQNQSPKALSQYIEALSQSFKNGEIAYQRGKEEIFEKAITNSVLIRNQTGYYSIEKIDFNSNVRIDPVDACLDAYVANYIDNAKDIKSGDEDFDDWEELLGGGK